MKTKIILAVAVFFVANSYAQITKGNWLVGGNAAFSHAKFKSPDMNLYNSTTVTVAPNIGYFLWDKFCSGIKISFQLNKQDYPDNSTNGSISYSSKTQFYNIGPFVRYYLLKPDKLANVVIEVSYQHQMRKDISPNSNTKQNANMFMISGGPVVYFNSSIGMEFTIGYAHQRFDRNVGSNNYIQASLGLQVHLRKDD